MGLLDRAVQSMKSYLRGRCIEQASTEEWSIDIQKGVVFANTKSQKIHGYISAKLILGFSPRIKHFDVESEPPTETDLEIVDTTEHQKQIYMALRDENCCLASEASAYSHYSKIENRGYPRQVT